MTVLSLFDGISCGQVALKRAGIRIDNYFASEVDRFAIAVTQKNHPNTIQLGDVRGVKACDLPKIDLLIGGSPCQGFSFAGKQLNFNDPRSKLFFEYVRILNEVREVNPDVLFVLENVEMKREYQRVINDHIGVYPVNINAKLVSAQMRGRLWWTNILTERRGLFGEVHAAIPQPVDRGIYLSDVLQAEKDVPEKYYLKNEQAAALIEKIAARGGGARKLAGGAVNDRGTLRGTDKAHCIDANHCRDIDNHAQRTVVVYAAPHGTNIGAIDECNKFMSLTTVSATTNFIQVGKHQHDRVHLESGKMSCVPAGTNRNASDHLKTLVGGRIRKLTPLEVSRLTTLPDDYFFENGTQIQSDSQCYKQCGNGWVVDVAAHIFSFIKKGHEKTIANNSLIAAPIAI